MKRGQLCHFCMLKPTFSCVSLHRKETICSLSAVDKKIAIGFNFSKKVSFQAGWQESKALGDCLEQAVEFAPQVQQGQVRQTATRVVGCKPSILGGQAGPALVWAVCQEMWGCPLQWLQAWSFPRNLLSTLSICKILSLVSLSLRKTI